MPVNNYLFRWMIHKVEASSAANPSYYSIPEAVFHEIAGYVESLYPGGTIYTFDDGNDTDIEVSLPVLQKIGAEQRGYFFITTSRIGEEGYLTKSQIQNLSKFPVTIGSHGHTHRFFNEMEDMELRDELKISKAILEDHTGKPVDQLSIPGGKFDGRLAKFAMEADYASIFTSDPWDRSIEGIDFYGRFCINRNNLHRLQKIYSMPKLYGKMLVGEHLGKKLVRDILGNRLYYSVTSKIGKKNDDRIR